MTLNIATRDNKWETLTETTNNINNKLNKITQNTQLLTKINILILDCQIVQYKGTHVLHSVS